jgi:xanthine dehydrogenase accessory factor
MIVMRNTRGFMLTRLSHPTILQNQAQRSQKTPMPQKIDMPDGAKYARQIGMDLFEEIVRMRRAGERGALATIVHTNGSIPSYESSRMLVREDGSIAGTIGGGCVEADVWAAAKEVMQIEQPRKMTFNLNHEAEYDAGLICGGTLEIFVEPILPQPVLYIFGGGHVSSAVARSASAVGFGIAIADDREAFANAERFPMAGELYTTYEDAFEKIKPNASSYLLIVTRGHKDDMRVLAWAVRTDARYIGMIGSKRKVLSVYKALEREGYSPREFERVHAPVGLDIGALSPEEIAVSIAAELIAVRRNAQNLSHKSVMNRLTTARAV